MTVTPEQLATALQPLSAKLDSLETSAQAVHSRIDQFGFELHSLRDSVSALGDDLRKVTDHVLGDGTTAPVRYVMAEQARQIAAIEAAAAKEKEARETEEKAKGRGRVALISSAIASVTAVVVALLSICGGMGH